MKMNWFEKIRLKGWENKYIYNSPYSTHEWYKVIGYLEKHPSVVYEPARVSSGRYQIKGNSVKLIKYCKEMPSEVTFSKGDAQEASLYTSGDYQYYKNFPEKVKPFLRKRLMEVLKDLDEFLKLALAEEAKIKEENDNKICESWGAKW